ncbi:MAG: 4-hydroxy-tetrahydrodipicolinate synthase [Aristaeellaceae bacterium]
MKPLFTGCGTALITPFKGGEIDWDTLDQLVEEQIASGVDALIATGTTGEPSTMTWEEHVAVIRRVADRAAGRVAVIAGTGSNCTSEAIHAAKEVEDCGASGLLVVTPYYNKTTQEGLVAHFHAIADASKLPLIVYNVPGRTGLNILPATLKRIVAHDNIVGVKEASGNMDQSMEKLLVCGEDAAFYSGEDALIVPLMVMGYKGVISVLSNAVPKETADMAHLALAGRYDEAAALQMKYLPFIHALFSETSPIPCKAAMAMMGKCEEELRLPLIPMQSGNREKMAGIMRELGLLH